MRNLLTQDCIVKQIPLQIFTEWQTWTWVSHQSNSPETEWLFQYHFYAGFEHVQLHVHDFLGKHSSMFLAHPALNIAFIHTIIYHRLSSTIRGHIEIASQDPSSEDAAMAPAPPRQELKHSSAAKSEFRRPYHLCSPAPKMVS